jgi:hypothetical protein
MSNGYCQCLECGEIYQGTDPCGCVVDPLAGRCGTCKYWTTGSWVDDGYGQCDEATYSSNPLVIIQLHGMGDTLLATAPDFGCVLWEKRDE